MLDAETIRRLNQPRFIALCANPATAERRHARCRWTPSNFFDDQSIPLYLLASLWVALRGKRPYFDNPFEREAERLAPTTALQGWS